MGLDVRGLSFLAAAFVLLLAAAVLVNLLRRRGRVLAGRATLAGLWVAYTAALVPLGFPQYGFSSVPPAAISTGLALLIVYAVAGRSAASGLPAVARVLVAAVFATAMLPLALLWSLTVLRIDNL
jgi:CubicO group peptidase (beta-lactamase class C family)